MLNQILAADAAAGTGNGSQWYVLVILGAFFVLMIVMTIVPQKKRQKQMQNMMDNLSIGDKVMTIGRLIGKIVAIDTDNKQVTLNVGTDDSETLIVIDKNAIGYVIDGKNKSVQEEKPKKENLGIHKKNKNADQLPADGESSASDAENTNDISFESNEDIKIDNGEDIKF